MAQMNRYVYLLITFLLTFPTAGSSQTGAPSDTTKQLLLVAREIMASANNCALITVDDEGRPRARVMDPFPPEEDFTVWFGTNPRSRKVEQIREDPNVALYYLEENGGGYVILYGTAILVSDQEEKDRRWKVEWQPFYPDKTDNYLLIRVDPEWLEVVSYAHGITGDPVTWEPPRVILRQE